MPEDQQHPQREPHHRGQHGPPGLPLDRRLRQQLKEHHVQHRAPRQGQSRRQGRRGLVPHQIARQRPRHRGQAGQRRHGDGVHGFRPVVEQGDGDAHPLRQVVQADGDGGQHAGQADPLHRHRGPHRHAHRDVVQGHRRRQHNARRVQVVVAAGAVMGVGPVLVVGTPVDPAVQQVGYPKARHQRARHQQQGGRSPLQGLRRLGHHIQRHDGQHQPRGKAQQQARPPGGLPLHQGRQPAPQGQPAHPGGGGEQYDK